MFYINRPTVFFNVKEMSLEAHPLHLHNYFEIIHLSEGEVIFHFGTARYKVKAGEYIYIPANLPHAYSAEDPAEPVRMRILSCCTDILPMHRKNLLEYLPQAPVIPKELAHPDLLYAEQRLAEMEQGRDSDVVLFAAYISVMLCRMFPVMQLTKTKNAEDLTSGVVTYLANHYLEPLTLDSLAKEFGVSKYKISRTFTNVLGTNLTSSINSLRISHAGYLLLSTEQSITAIALDCGFSNQQTFNRVFKEHNGCTPKEYRQEHSVIREYPELSLSFPNSLK